MYLALTSLPPKLVALMLVAAAVLLATWVPVPVHRATLRLLVTTLVVTTCLCPLRRSTASKLASVLTSLLTPTLM